MTPRYNPPVIDYCLFLGQYKIYDLYYAIEDSQSTIYIYALAEDHWYWSPLTRTMATNFSVNTSAIQEAQIRVYNTLGLL